MDTSLLSWLPDKTEANTIISKLPNRFKDGQMWLDKGDGLNYFLVYLASVAFAFFLYLIFWRCFNRYRNSQYLRRDEGQRVRFINGWV